MAGSTPWPPFARGGMRPPQAACFLLSSILHPLFPLTVPVDLAEQGEQLFAAGGVEVAYVGDVASVRTSIDLACRLVEAVRRK